MAGKRLGFTLSNMISNKDARINYSGNGENEESESAVSVVGAESIPVNSIAKIPAEAFVPGKYQPRRIIDDKGISELAESIKSEGLIQPVSVRAIADGKFEIIAGERRWRACKLAGMKEIPAIVIDADDRKAMAVSIIENLQREDLNAIEESDALRKMADELGLTHDQIGEIIGKSRSHVSNLLRLGSLPDAVKQFVISGQIDMGHARALLKLENGAAAIEVAKTVASRGLSVRETEALVNKKMESVGEQNSPAKKILKDQDTIEWESEIKSRIGCSRVQLQKGAGDKGKLIMSYSSAEELEKLLNFINR